MLSTHLLSDIEQVCDSAVILHQGEVVSAGGLSELRAARRRSYRIAWSGEDEPFLDRLRQITMAARAMSGGKARVVVADDFSTDALFRAAVESSVTLTSLEPEEDDLEAIYLRLIGTSESPHTPSAGAAP